MPQYIRRIFGMFLAIAFLILLITLELVLNFRKHLTYAFSLYFAGIAFMLFGSILYIIKISTFSATTDLDLQLYRIINRMSFSLGTVSRIMNIGAAFVMLGSVYTFNIIGRKKSIFKLTLLIVPVFLFIIIYDHTVTYRIFLLVNREPQSVLRLRDAHVLGFNRAVRLVFMLYLFAPLFFVYKTYRRTRIHALFVNAVFLGICLAFIGIYVTWCFVGGFLSAFMPWNVDLNKFPTVFFADGYRRVFLPLTLFITMAVLYITIWYKPLGSVKFINGIARSRTFREIGQNLRMVFHATKNTYLAVQRLTRQAAEYIRTDPDTAESILSDIEDISAKGLSTLTHSMNMLDEVSGADAPIDLSECVRDALGRLSKPQSIRISLHLPEEPVIISAAFFHISESILNILSNSVDAIAQARRTHGEITVELCCDNGYACLEISDNGCGIPKKDIKKIFSILYSTKKTSDKWGIGLSYVQKVADAYGGFTYVKSEEGKYTVFQLALPLSAPPPRKKRRVLPLPGNLFRNFR